MPGYDLVGFGGYATSGKDTAAYVLVRWHKYRLLSYGRQVAALLAEVNPLVEVDPTVALRARVILEDQDYEKAKLIPDFVRLLQDLGSAVNDRDPEFWSRTVLADVVPGSRTVLSGLRSREQVAAVRERYGLTVWIERPGVGPRNGHRNELAAGPEDFDVVVVNDGTVADLHRKIDSLLGLRRPRIAPNGES